MNYNPHQYVKIINFQVAVPATTDPERALKILIYALNIDAPGQEIMDIRLSPGEDKPLLALGAEPKVGAAFEQLDELRAAKVKAGALFYFDRERYRSHPRESAKLRWGLVNDAGQWACRVSFSNPNLVQLLAFRTRREAVEFKNNPVIRGELVHVVFEAGES